MPRKLSLVLDEINKQIFTKIFWTGEECSTMINGGKLLDKRLQRARRRTRLLAQEVSEYYSNYKITNDLLELRNLITIAELIIQSAIQRKESRGLHFTLDYPNLLPEAKDTILVPPNFG